MTTLVSNYVLYDVIANRPTFHSTYTAGRLFYATDEGKIYRDNGTTWDDLAVGSGIYQPLDADLTVIAALNATGFLRQAGTGSWSIVAETGTGSVVRGTAPTITDADLAATLLKLTTSTILTIATGAVTATQSFHRVDTEASAASDDLDTISGGVAGLRLTLRASDAARTVVLKHNTGNILLFGAADLSLDETYKFVELIYDGDLTKWVQIGGTGGSGTIGGSTGATDNALLRSDGTGGATVQASPVTMNDSGDTNFADALMQRALFKDSAEALVVVASSGAAYTIDLENGNAVELTLDADCTLTFSNPPATGRLGSFTLTTIQDVTGAWNITWPVSVAWLNGGAPAPDTTTGTKAVYVFWTTDGGTSWLGAFSGDDSGTVTAVSAFTDLSDVPAAYTGHANKVVSVNAGETALEFTTSAAGSGLPEFGAATIVALSSGVLAAGANRHLVAAAETGTADDLIEITGLAVGDEAIVRADTGDTITIKHNDAGATDKIILYDANDLALSGDKTLKLVKIATGKLVQYVDKQGAGGSTLSNTLQGVRLLARVTLGSPGSTLDTGASAIPTGYKYIRVIAHLRDTGIANGYTGAIQFNGDTTGANYLAGYDYGGSSVSNGVYNNGNTMDYEGANYGGWSTFDFNIFGYDSTSYYKSMFFNTMYQTGSASLIEAHYGLIWKNTANAINQIAFVKGGTNFDTGSWLEVWGYNDTNILVP